MQTAPEIFDHPDKKETLAKEESTNSMRERNGEAAANRSKETGTPDKEETLRRRNKPFSKGSKIGETEANCSKEISGFQKQEIGRKDQACRKRTEKIIDNVLERGERIGQMKNLEKDGLDCSAADNPCRTVGHVELEQSHAAPAGFIRCGSVHILIQQGPCNRASGRVEQCSCQACSTSCAEEFPFARKRWENLTKGDSGNIIGGRVARKRLATWRKRLRAIRVRRGMLDTAEHPGRKEVKS